MDDFYNFLVRIRDANLKTADGTKIWPLLFHQDNAEAFYNAFPNIWGSKIANFNYYDERAQGVKFMARAPQVTSALQWLIKCLNNGLLDPEIYTFKGNTQIDELNRGKYAFTLTQFWMNWVPDAVLSAQNPEMYYRAIDLPQGTPGVPQNYGFYNISGTAGTQITKNAKNPEAAIRLLDYMLSPEGGILSFYGIEGKTMGFRNGKPYLYPEAYDAKMADWAGFGKASGIRVFDIVANQAYNWERDSESPERQKDRALARKYAFDCTVQVVTSIDPLTDEGILLAEIQANIVAQLTRIILDRDESKVQSALNALVAEYERKGLAKLETAWTKQYQE
jgi:putative aldouronate transport system substrate-binding protein